VIFAETNDVDLARRTPIAKQVLSSKNLERLGWRGRHSTEKGVEHTIRILSGK
jgi:hypothetical protein